MASSERRWASSRKSGMTVLGKVPKPINLPSQKLENHGLDPNVEIVPKGTLTWGTRPLTASNAWGPSSFLSLQTDGSVSSSINASFRPSSGGSTTCPSTAGSERSNESAWGPNSRPSSASGIFPSSQITIASNRPRSAETRPGSAQLSRFSGNSSDHNAWVSEGSSERLDVGASKASDFSLSSVDFPSLGSEKNFEQKSLGHDIKGHPVASGLAPETLLTYEAPEKVKSDHKGHGNFNSWNEDSQAHARQVGPTNMGNLQRDHPNLQLQYNTNMPSQRGSWGGHHVIPPDSFWCGGHETDGLYRPLGAPGSYPIDPYYPCPSARELPVRAFVRPDVSSGGHHFRVGEACRGMPLEPYVGSSKALIGGMPGIYPSPALHEGSYGPHVNNGSSCKRDAPIVGFSDVEAAHYQYSSQNPGVEHGWFHALPDGNSSAVNKEHMVAGQAYEIQGKSEVLLKRRDGQVDTGSQEEQFVVAQSTQHGERGLSLREKCLPGKIHTHEQISKKQLCDIGSSQLGSISDPGIINFSARSNTGEHNMMQKPDASSIPVSDVLHNPTCENTASLMEKVESLNGKARSANIHSGSGTLYSKEKKIARNVSYGSDHCKKVDSTSSSSSSFNAISDSSRLNTNSMNSRGEVNIHVSTSDSNPACGQSEQVLSPAKLNSSEASEHSHSHNQKEPNLNERISHRTGLKFGGFDVNNMDKVPVNANEKNKGAVVSVLPLLHCHGSQEVQDGKDFHLKVEAGCETYVPIFVDSVDHEVQRAKLKELARQRASELQNEEEERTREQKAKAQVKLEELNMRTTAVSKHNPDIAKLPCSSDLEEGAKFDKHASGAPPAPIVEEPSDSFCSSEVEKQESHGSIRPEDPVDVLFNSTPKTMEQPFPLAQGTIQKITTSETAGNLQENTVLRPEQVSFRGRQNIPRERSQTENTTDLDFSGQLQCGSAVSREDPSFHPKKKNSRGPKLKHKLNDSHLNSTSQSSAHLDGGDAKGGAEDDEPKPMGMVAEVASISHNNSTEIIECQGVKDSMVVPIKEVSVKVNSDWKPHPQKKPARNQYKTNAKHPGSETVVWTPVKVSNKNGPSEEVTKNNAIETTDLSSQKDNQRMHNGSKAKRAEMERYIPKNVSKELSRDSTSPSLASMLHADMPDKLESVSSGGVTRRDDRPTVVTIALAFDNRNIESTKPNRRGKSHVSWRQRNSVEPTLFEPSAIESNSYIEKNSADNNSEFAEGGKIQQDVAVSKTDYGLNRQRRHQFMESKDDRSSSVQTDNEGLQGDQGDRNGSHFFPTNSGEKNYSRTSNQNLPVDHTKPRWQPKSQVRCQISQVRRVNDGQRNTENVLPSQNVEENVDESVTEVKDTRKQELMIETTVISEHPKDKTQILKNGRFPGERDTSFSEKQNSCFGGGTRKDGHYFEHYKTESKDKPGATEAATESLHRPFSAAKYGNRGRNPPRHGGTHFNGPRRGAATRMNGE